MTDDKTLVERSRNERTVDWRDALAKMLRAADRIEALEADRALPVGAAEVIAAARRIAALNAENRDENAALAADYGRLVRVLIVAVRRLDESG